MASAPDGRTLGEVGEFGLIDELVARFPQGEQVLVGPGDDAALLRIRNGHVIVSTDLMVEGRHFRRDWGSAADIGHRAAAQNLSDLNAMGGTAHSLTIGLAAPADLPAAWALELADGFAEMRFAGFVTVSARDDEELERASGEIEHAGQLARLEFQRMYGEQEAAFTNTLPLCRGLR